MGSVLSTVGVFFGSAEGRFNASPRPQPHPPINLLLLRLRRQPRTAGTSVAFRRATAPHGRMMACVLPCPRAVRQRRHKQVSKSPHI
jgi:hypothetical protein